MTQTCNTIHAATIVEKGGKKKILLLKQSDEGFFWDGTSLKAPTFSEAMELGQKSFKHSFFTPLKCGFLYTLPERDEHGMNATFDQMCKSYSSSNGQFFEPSLGHMCFVQGASQEALKLMRGEKS